MRRHHGMLCSIFCLGQMVPGVLHAEDLSSAWRAARTHVPALSAQEARLSASKFQKSVAMTEYLPVIRADARIGRGSVQEPVKGELEWQDDKPGSWEVKATELVFDGFGRLSRNRAADAAESRERHGLRQTEERVALDLVNAYVDVLRFRALEAIAGQNLAEGGGIKALVDQQVSSGKAAGVDTSLADTELADAADQQIQQVGQRQRAEMRYEELTGQQPGVLEMPASPRLPATEADAVALAMRQHPAVQVADAEVHQARYQAHDAASRFSPKVDLEAFYHGQNNNLTGTPDADEKGVNLVVSYDILAGGRDYYGWKKNQALQTAADRDLAEVRRQVRQDLQSTYIELATRRNRLRELSRQVASDEKVFKVYALQMKSGYRQPLDVFVVQDSLYRARLAHRSAMFDVIQSEYEVLARMGKLSALLAQSETPAATATPEL